MKMHALETVERLLFKTINKNRYTMKFRSIFKLFLLLFVVACSKEEPTPTPPPTPKYTVVFTASDGGSVSTEGGSYEKGTKINVTATAEDGYVFDSWSDGNTDNPREITVNSNLSLTANFTKIIYSLTVNIEGEGSVEQEVVVQNSTSTSEYEEVTTLRLIATPSEEWVFSGWSGAVESTDNPIEITVDEAKEITATFKLKQYDLTINVEGEGTVSETIVTQPALYDSGTVVKLEATPSEEWVFSGWSGAVESTDNPIEITVDEAKEITATFKRVQYDLTINVEGEGTVSETIVTQPALYDSGTVVKLEATPSEEWVFSGWSGAVESTDNPIEIAVDEAKEITAKFTPVNNQGGYDQPPVTNARIALVPIDFTDTEESIRALFPTKDEILDLVISDKIKDYFSTVSYNIFSFDVEVFETYHYPGPGLINGSIYGTDQVFNHDYAIPTLDPNDFDHILFVPIHDYQLAGGRAGTTDLKVNGVTYQDVKSVMTPIHIGYNQRDTRYPFSNTSIDKKSYLIPLGSTTEEEGLIEYDFSNFEQTFIHEFIHSLGIGTHSFSKTNGDRPDYETLIDNNNGYESRDYGDKFCVMGSGEYALSLTAAYRDYLGWHNNTVRERVDEFGVTVVDLFPINTINNTSYIEVRIPNKVSDFDFVGYKNEGYFLEVRSGDDPYDRFLKDNTNLSENLNGVFVKKTDGYTSWLLDMSPSPNINYYDQPIADIRDVVLKPSMTYENEDIRISTIAKNADGSFTIEIEIKY